MQNPTGRSGSPRRHQILMVLLAAIGLVMMFKCLSPFGIQFGRLASTAAEVSTHRVGGEKRYINETLSLVLTSDEFDSTDLTSMHGQKRYQNETLLISFEAGNSTTERAAVTPPLFVEEKENQLDKSASLHGPR